MAKCDEGYLCSICGGDVEDITQSDLYLRYVTGMLDPELLHAEPERHIRCNPTLAQFIVADDFETIHVDGDFDKSQLDSDHVRQRESLVTRGWNRLKEIRSLGEVSILEFPLPEAVEKFKNRASSTPNSRAVED
ncbi:MAG: hypothetical protein ACKVHR_01025 [Pirellulales bacterium]|jgi:hypothetical protein